MRKEPDGLKAKTKSHHNRYKLRPSIVYFFFFFPPYICTIFSVYLLASLQIFPSEPTACWKTSSHYCFASPFPWWKTQVSKSPLARQEQVCGSSPSGPLLSCRGDLDVGAWVLLTMFNQAYCRDANSKQTSRWMSWPLPSGV